MEKDFRFVNRETYRKFILNEKLAQFDYFRNGSRSGNSSQNLICQKIVLRFLLELQEKSYIVVFFDISSICPASFKQKAWILPTGRSRFGFKTSFKPLKLFACLTQAGILTLRFFNKSNAETVREFLLNSLAYIQATYNHPRVVIFLDNAPVNRDEAVLSICQQHEVIFLFNAVETPILNSAERYFEYAKRDLRRQTFTSDFNSITKILERTKKYNFSLMTRGLRKEAPKILRILQGDSF